MKKQMKKLNGNQKKFLGTVPKKYQLVETFWDCPEISKTSNKGITLIALIITIVLNCSYLAMVEGKRIYKIIENRRNLLYNRLCN